METNKTTKTKTLTFNIDNSVSFVWDSGIEQFGYFIDISSLDVSADIYELFAERFSSDEVADNTGAGCWCDFYEVLDWATENGITVEVQCPYDETLDEYLEGYTGIYFITSDSVDDYLLEAVNTEIYSAFTHKEHDQNFRQGINYVANMLLKRYPDIKFINFDVTDTVDTENEFMDDEGVVYYNKTISEKMLNNISGTAKAVITKPDGISLSELVKMYTVFEQHGADAFDTCINVIKHAVEPVMSYAEFTDRAYAEIAKQYGVEVTVVGDNVEYRFTNADIKSGTFPASHYSNYVHGAIIEGLDEVDYLVMLGATALEVLETNILPTN